MIELYVELDGRATLERFEDLGPIWSGPAGIFEIGPDCEESVVIGWADAGEGIGEAVDVNVCRARWLPPPDGVGGPPEPVTGVLIFGGEAGLRIFDLALLDNGYRVAFVWLADAGALPRDVQRVVCNGMGGNHES